MTKKNTQRPINDPETGRPWGDHGTSAQAIEWSLHVNRDGQVEEFLSAWQTGLAAEEWPEFYEWLREEERVA